MVLFPPPAISSGTSRKEPSAPDEKHFSEEEHAPVLEKAPFTIQGFLDKWFLPVVFVLIGGVIGWALAALMLP